MTLKFHTKTRIAVLACSISGLLTSTVCSQTTPPGDIAKIIGSLYPQAVITEIEHEVYRGNDVLEVEIDHGSGKRRILMTHNGDILSDKKIEEIPIIGGQLTVGLGGRLETSAYRGVDDELLPQPAVIYRNGGFEFQAFDGLYTSYTFFSPFNIELALYGELAFEGFDPGDSSYLSGMEGTNPTFSIGLLAAYPTRFVDFELTAINEVTGEHSGQEVEFAIKKTFQVFSASVTPSFALEYLSDKVTEYYVGVSAAEALVDRPRYSPDSALNVEAELLVTYPLGKGFDLATILEYTLLDSTMSDSPIIEDDYELSVTVGLLYTF